MTRMQNLDERIGAPTRRVVWTAVLLTAALLPPPLLAGKVLRQIQPSSPVLQQIPQLQVQLISKDFEVWGTEKVIFSPELLKLGWGQPLTAPSAVWKLASEPFPTRNIIATGTATNAGGEWGFFNIDLNGVIPSQPPAGGEEDYFIQVYPSGDNLVATSVVRIVYKEDTGQTVFTPQGIYPAGPRIYDYEFTQTGDTWAQTDHKLGGKKKKDWLCVLSKIKGTFGGHDEKVRVYTDKNGDWRIRTRSSEPGMAIKATCVHISLLGVAPGGQPQIGNFSLRRTDDDGLLCGRSKKDLWPDGSQNICFLNGLMGPYVSRKESLGIYGDQLIVNQCEDGEYGAYATCATAKYSQNDIKSIDTAKGPFSRDLLEVKRGLCALATIRGEFADGAMVEIVRKNGWWKLVATGHDKNEDALKVSAMCWVWHQRDVQ